MEQPVNKQIIRKYLQGECTPAELQVIDKFLQRKDADELIDQVLNEKWAEFQEEEIADEEIAGWRNRFLQERLHDNSMPVKRLGKKFFTFRYAAVWLTALVGLGIWFGLGKVKTQQKEAFQVNMLERVNANGQRVQIRLSDSSIVYLAGGSRLRYPSRFIGSTREVTLQGEAFFEIAKNAKRPFIISTGQIKTNVVGTSFRINAFTDKPFKIQVATGKVRISHQKGKHQTPLALLTRGQTLLWKNNHATLGETNADDVSEWKNGRLTFDGATLKEVTDVLERWYDVDIHFKRQRKANQHITITLSATVPLTEILQVLAGAGKFQYEIQGRHITIN